MLSDSVRQRLAAMNRQPLPLSPSGDKPLPEPPLPVRHERALVLSPRIGQQRIVRTDSGEHLSIRLPVTKLWRQCEQQGALARVAGVAGAGQAVHDELQALFQQSPERALYLDLETCGFAGSAIFLIGLLHSADGELVVEQLLARNYAEERPILETLWRRAGAHRVLVTFNGKSFDWPMVNDRSTRYHLGFEPADRRGRPRWESFPKTDPAINDPATTSQALSRDDPRPQLTHCDLLHHARRQWKQHLPDCRLKTLEQYICGRRRDGDIQGQYIPDAYHRYVRTGDDRQIKAILRHNVLDLVTLFQLALRMCTDTASGPKDLFAAPA